MVKLNPQPSKERSLTRFLECWFKFSYNIVLDSEKVKKLKLNNFGKKRNKTKNKKRKRSGPINPPKQLKKNQCSKLHSSMHLKRYYKRKRQSEA